MSRLFKIAAISLILGLASGGASAQSAFWDAEYWCQAFGFESCFEVPDNGGTTQSNNCSVVQQNGQTTTEGDC